MFIIIARCDSLYSKVDLMSERSIDALEDILQQVQDERGGYISGCCIVA
jgi:hypothetical protein